MTRTDRRKRAITRGLTAALLLGLAAPAGAQDRPWLILPHIAAPPLFLAPPPPPPVYWGPPRPYWAPPPPYWGGPPPPPYYGPPRQWGGWGPVCPPYAYYGC